MNKFDIIMPNDVGRKYTIRYKQYAYDRISELNDWSIANSGCGVCSIASILSSFGYNLDPIDVAKMMFSNEHGLLDFYVDLSQKHTGIRELGIIYFLNKIIYERKCDIGYEIVKFNYFNPTLAKNKIINMISENYMAIICVGPVQDSPRTFSNYGHYLVVSSVNNENHEFYVVNSNKTGDLQIDTTFSYETVVKNMYQNSFDFLMIKNNDPQKRLITNKKNYI